MGKHPADILDEAGQVRVLSRQCDTCIFWPDDRMHLAPGRFEQIVEDNIAAGALLTCHATLPYGEYPDYGPAACAGFHARHGMKTAAGRMARVIGIVRVPPPGEETS
jgi:hypothetical protein